MTEIPEENIDNEELDHFTTELDKTKSSWGRKAIEIVIMVGLGQIPWFGSLLAAGAKMFTGKRDSKREQLQNQWLEELSKKVKKLMDTLQYISERYESLGEEIDERLQSEEYLDIVRKAFKAWDSADTDEKRKYVANLITNAAGTKLCSDDVIRLFIDWLNLYHEIHFAIIKSIFNTPGVTRYDIWQEISGENVREDSAEADLYKKLIRDLSTGGVIRQARDTTEDGRFLKKRNTGSRIKTTTMESAFEDSKQYMLTDLGKEFVHYTMNESITRLKQ